MITGTLYELMLLISSPVNSSSKIITPSTCDFITSSMTLYASSLECDVVNKEILKPFSFATSLIPLIKFEI